MWALPGFVLCCHLIDKRLSCADYEIWKSTHWGLEKWEKLNGFSGKLCGIERVALSEKRPDQVRKITQTKATELCHSRSHFLLVVSD